MSGPFFPGLFGAPKLTAIGPDPDARPLPMPPPMPPDPLAQPPIPTVPPAYVDGTMAMGTPSGPVYGPNAQPDAPFVQDDNSWRAKLAQGLKNAAMGPFLPISQVLDSRKKEASQKAVGEIQRQADLASLSAGSVTPSTGTTYNAPGSPTLASLGLGARTSYGGGGGLGAGNKLKSDYDAAQQAQLHAYDTDQLLQDDLAKNDIAKHHGVNALNMEFAARQQRDAQLQQEADQAAAQKHEAFLARQTELADQIGAMKIDPQRMYRNMGSPEKFGFVVSSLLSGATNPHQANAALDRYDRMAKADVDAQLAEVDNKKTQISARQSIFQQMLAETGDRRVAASATRNLMYEGLKAQIGATADELGLPSLRTNADMAIQAIKERQLAFDTELKRTAYQTFLAQAGAAAAAQRAAEDRAWNRSMDVAKLGLEQDKLRVEAAKAGSKGDEDLQNLSKALADPKLAEGRATIDDIRARLGQQPTNEGLPGVGPGADIRAALATPARGGSKLGYTPQGMLANEIMGLSPSERVGRGDWNRFKLSYQHAITGAGASEHERATINSALEGARTPTEQRAAVEQADQFYRQIEARHRAGFSPSVNATYDARLNTLSPQMPTGMRIEPSPGIPSDERFKRFAQKLGGGKILSDERAKQAVAHSAFREGLKVGAAGPVSSQVMDAARFAGASPSSPMAGLASAGAFLSAAADAGAEKPPQLAPQPAQASAPLPPAPTGRSIAQMIGVDKIPGQVKATALRMQNATNRAIDSASSLAAGAPSPLGEPLPPEGAGKIPSDERMKNFARKLGCSYGG